MNRCARGRVNIVEVYVAKAAMACYSDFYFRHLNFGPHFIPPHIRFKILKHWEEANFVQAVRDNILFNCNKSLTRLSFEYYGEGSFFDEDFKNLSYQEIRENSWNQTETSWLKLWQDKCVSSPAICGVDDELNFRGRLFKLYIPTSKGSRMELLMGTAYVRFIGLRPVFRVFAISPIAWFQGSITRLEQCDLDRSHLGFYRVPRKITRRHLVACKPRDVYFAKHQREDVFATIGHIMRNKRENEIIDSRKLPFLNAKGICAEKLDSFKMMHDAVKIGDLTIEGMRRFARCYFFLENTMFMYIYVFYRRKRVDSIAGCCKKA